MTEQIWISLETAKRLSVQQELHLARLARSAAPASVRTRSQLAYLLVHNDYFDEAIGILEDADDLDFAEAMALAQALLSRETAEANERVRATADRAFTLADDDAQRAAALADRGKAELRLGLDGAVDTLTDSLRLDPHNKNACKRIAAHYLRAGDPGTVLRLVNALEAQGVGHSRLLAARTLAHAQRGEIGAARASVGMADFLHSACIDPPEGWQSIDTFNAALAEQLLAHPALRYERYGSASEQTWRIDAPMSRSAPLVGLLLEQIRKTVAGHLEAITHHDHPWLRARPAAGKLHSWSVITESTGYETWHVHQFGWLSGVYYVRIPDSIAHGADEGGCIAWGVPDDIVGAEAAQAYGDTRMRPKPGMLLLFPSHAYHRTFPHGSTERRICIAFDIWPR